MIQVQQMLKTGLKVFQVRPVVHLEMLLCVHGSIGGSTVFGQDASTDDRSRVA